MKNENEITQFAPAGRYEIEEVKYQAKKILESTEFKKLTNAIPDIFMILNAARQVVFSNSRLAEFLNAYNVEDFNGKRPGEVFNCIHANKTAGGCGTTEYCSVCGAAKAALLGLDGIFSTQECRISTNDGTDALDLKVWASPYNVNGVNYTVFAIQDISNEKRRSVLEKVFFHDIINTAGGLKGLTEIIKDSPEEINEFKDILFTLSESLIDEINAQRQLLNAERNELAVNLHLVNSYNLIETAAKFYQNHYVSDGKHIIVNATAEKIDFFTDEALARRVIGNMLKNAIEATPIGGTITLDADEHTEYIVISIHNPSVMTKEIKLQMFQRSFSTKGEGRGLGTYSMKLLLEKYLKGKISFESEEGKGTTFYASFRKDSLDLNMLNL